MSAITDTRHALRAAVEPLLGEGERVTVSAGPSEYEGNLNTLGFQVTVTVGPAGEEASAERLDELLSGAVKAALEDIDLRPLVTKTSGYQTFAHQTPPQLGAVWTALVHE